MPAQQATATLVAAEGRNIKTYGFGVKSFTLSMIETAIAISEGAVEAATITQLIAMGRDMLDHEIELLPHVENTLKALHGDYKLLLITKGDLHHQERKVLASGLAPYFEGVDIVSDKTSHTYSQIVARHASAPARALMVGNSLKSDVLPMIRAGGYGVYVPFAIAWDFEHEEVPEGTERFYEVADLSGLLSVVESI
ncbi:MAG: HAD hydrolase-like protein [Alphaproteobacteria bacterium]|nr:HAD hydrolase-like protein [Alphaproteobacteria bacterium]